MPPGSVPSTELAYVRDLARRLYKSSPAKVKDHLRPIVREEVDSRQVLPHFKRAVAALLRQSEGRVSAPLMAEVERWAAYHGTQTAPREGRQTAKRLDVTLSQQEYELLSSAARRSGKRLATYLRDAAMLAAEKEPIKE